MPAENPPMITSKRGLEQLVARALETDAVAVDTEFVWERTYYPRLGLIQLALSEDDFALLDPVAMEDLSPLGELLSSSDTVKILHDAPQDLMILHRATGAPPARIFDTRCAAGFCGLSATLSLANLLEEMLNVSLPKTQTRTNWLKRPLTPAQLSYAVDDVRYLPEIRHLLLERVAEMDREPWLRDEMQTLEHESVYTMPDPRRQFRRIKGHGRLSPPDLAVLRELAAWREEEARRRDRPRGHIVPDGALLALARSKPLDSRHLQPSRNLSAKAIKRHEKPLLEAVARGVNVPLDKRPSLPSPPADPKEARVRADLALSVVRATCLAARLDVSLVATRAEVEALVATPAGNGPKASRLLSGWRRELVGEKLLRILNGEATVRIDSQTGLPRTEQHAPHSRAPQNQDGP